MNRDASPRYLSKMQLRARLDEDRARYSTAIETPPHFNQYNHAYARLGRLLQTTHRAVALDMRAESIAWHLLVRRWGAA